MKKLNKILLVVIGVLMLSALCTMMVFADSTITQDAVVETVSVSTGGDVKIHFMYSDFGSATEMVADIYAPGATEPVKTFTYSVSTLSGNIVTVPLSPDQMNYTVKVYAREGRAEGTPTSYSVVDYAQYILSSSAYSAHHNDMRALLNWGAMAQMYFSDVDSSEINGGYYSRGTNPVNDAITFFEGEGAVNDGALIDIEGWQIFLDPGVTTMKLYFSYAGSERLEAYVQKEDEEPVKVQLAIDADTDLYYVNVHNLGAAVYDKEYTLTVTDGTDTASVTKTALEYLNTVAFNDGFSDKQQDLAKAMYQFYTHAMDKVGECDHTSGLYSAQVEDATEAMLCSKCLAVIDTFPSEMDYYSNISHTTTRDVASNTTQRAQNLWENGLLFARSTPKDGGLTETTLSVGQNVTVGRYVFIKYRVSDKATGDMTVTLQSGDDTDNVYICPIALKDVQTNGWRIAAVNIEQHAFRTEHANAADLKISIQHYDTLDIAWVVMEEAQDNSSIRNAFIESGESYYYCGTYFNQIGHGQRRDKNGNRLSDVVLVKNVGASATTYKYVCTFCNGEICGIKDGHEKTFPNNVFNADITAITSGGTKEIKSENGMVYTHVRTNGNSVTTTITANNVPAGAAMFMKYRLANGSTPTGSFRVQVEFNGQVVSNGTVSETDIAKRHVGWVVGRINAKTAVEAICRQGTIINSVIITIIHSDDLDIAYFFTDPDTTEKNLNVFPQMVRDGDIYYMHQSTIFGSYAINQWRQITNASTGATSKPGASETASNLWPNPYNGLRNCNYGHTIAFRAGYSATCTETGLTNGTYCTSCGEIITAQETIPLRAHLPGAVEIKITPGSSCLDGGSYDEITYCAVCNVEISRITVETEAMSHTPVVDAAVAPTCTQTGLTEGSHCSVCGETLTAQIEIPKLAHTEEAIPNVAATCISDGSEGGVRCSVCDEILTAPTTIPKQGHSIVDSHTATLHATACQTCGMIFHSSNGSSWQQVSANYQYKCAECNSSFGNAKTFSNDVYYADITSITGTLVDGSSATVSTVVENGLIYTHIEGDGDKIKTTLSAENVPIGIALFFKYRLNDGHTPTGNFTMKLEYKYGDRTITVSGTSVLVGDLAKRHQGWVIGRVNATNAIQNAGITITGKTMQGNIADSLTVTIEHSDALDIAFLMTDCREDNSNVFPQMLKDGDIYYMHQSITFGSYASDQWRKVTSGTTYSSIYDSSLGNIARPGESYVADGTNGGDVTEDFSTVVSTNATPYDPKIAYGVTVNSTNHAYADTLNAAASLRVFDSDLPIRIDYVHEFERNETVAFEIVDFYGNAIYRAFLSGDRGDRIKVSAGFTEHPTGYFTIRIGGTIVDFYTVTPSLADRTVTDSPFAMDAATVQIINNNEFIEKYAAAMRLTGVTWVRERMQWSRYQTGNSNGSYTYNDSYLNQLNTRLGLIKRHGVNVLLTFSTAPGWATTLAQNSSGGSNITTGNFLGTYGTQLAVYDAAKRVASTLGSNVDVIELMNEPDHSAFLDLAEQYTSWFKSAALGIVDAGTGTKVSLSGMCQPTTWSDFTSIAITSDAMQYASIFNYHSHTSLPTSATIPDLNSTEAPVIKTIASTLDIYGVTKPVWITESGMAIPSFASESEKKQQAPYIVTSAAQALSYGTDKYFWFISSFYSESDGDNYSSFTRDHKPYPTIAAYSVMTSVLGKGEYAGDLKGLPENVRGYLFKTGNGDEMAAVIWRTSGSSTYTFSSNESVLKTNMMGQEEILYPNDSGKITVNVSTYPVYLTYTTAPDYYAHEYNHEELKVPELSLGDHVVITPEFEDATFDKDTKEKGHEIGDGTVINVRVTNHSSVAVTGSVSASLSGYTVQGTDTTITVAPHSDGYIKLTLSGSSNVNDLMKFTGTFSNGNTNFNCTPATAHVYKGSGLSGSIMGREIEFNVQTTLNQSISANNLSSVKVKMTNYDSKYSPVITIDGQRVDGIASISTSWLSSTLTLNLSSLTEGKHVVAIGLVSSGGDVQSYVLYVKYDGTNVILTTDW